MKALKYIFILCTVLFIGVMTCYADNNDLNTNFSKNTSSLLMTAHSEKSVALKNNYKVLKNAKVLASTTPEAYVFCHDEHILKGFRIVAVLILIIKILAPLFIIITGMVSLFKSTVDQDDSAINVAIKTLLIKFAVGVTIFFIPTIIGAILTVVNGYDTTKTKFSDCGKCLTSIKQCNSLINRYKK